MYAPKPKPNFQFSFLEVRQPHNRSVIKAFIKQRYQEVYGASIAPYSRELLALANPSRQVQAAVGYQGAEQGTLFLEQYLNQPIEALLSKTYQTTVNRNQIVEVGNLASLNNGWTRRLIFSLSSYFLNLNYRWLVMTATPQVINSFFKLGLGMELTALASATEDQLSSNDDWGSYYDEEPLVVCGSIARGGKKIERLSSHPIMSLPNSDQGIDLCLEGVL
ncbi:MAG: thermostable hemolysin [Motiliproteus sp.]|nr:thermostable hemolysin [Motiliproteus sp.]MCW9052625.1 thermostable hemolysin [Motiliproteus sp.]